MDENPFSFLRTNDLGQKPRSVGLTEIRGPYYSVMGKRYLEDILETMGGYVDSLKFAGGSFSLLPRKVLKELIDFAHQNNVLVSTGGFIESEGITENVATWRTDVVAKIIHQLGPEIVQSRAY